MNADKLKEALLYTLQNAGSMEIMRLAKFMYLADYTYAKTFGNKHGFINEHARFKYGPVPASFYPVINELLDAKVIERTGNIIKLENTDNTFKLSDEELACVDKVIEDFKGKSLNEVKRSAYATEPMVEIQMEEERLGVPGGLEFQKMDFTSVEVNPLMQPLAIDVSFLNSPDFKENMRDDE